jgi:hypothetical protein
MSARSAALAGLLWAVCQFLPATATAGINLQDFYAAVGSGVGNVRLYENNSGHDQARTYGSTPGGEFRVKFGSDWVTSDLGYFKTFCLERNETFSPGTPYYVTIDDLIYNGNTGTAGPDDIADITSVLFGLYAEGKLDDLVGTDFEYGENAPTVTLGNQWADAVQKVIWKQQDSFGTLDNNGLDLLGAIEDWIAAAGNAQELARYRLQVRALNVWTDADKTGRHQSQLFLDPTVPVRLIPPMPEPLSLAIWTGFAALGLSLARRQGKRAVT